MLRKMQVLSRMCFLIEQSMMKKYLSIRVFTDAQKRRVYERQGHKCPFCVKNGINTEYAYKKMHGDHIIP